MTFTKTRAWVAGTVVLSLLIAVAAWFLLISPKRAEAADIDAQTAQVAAQNDQSRARIASLKAEMTNMPKLQAERDALQNAVPATDRLNSVTRALTAAASANSMVLQSITPGSPAAIQAPAAATPAASGTASTATATASPTPAASSAVTGLVQIPLSVVVVGNYQNSEKLLQSLQTDFGGRDFLVTGLNIAPATTGPGYKTVVNGDVALTITGSLFALPDSATTTGTAATGTAATGTAVTPAASAAN